MAGRAGVGLCLKRLSADCWIYLKAALNHYALHLLVPASTTSISAPLNKSSPSGWKDQGILTALQLHYTGLHIHREILQVHGAGQNQCYSENNNTRDQQQTPPQIQLDSSYFLPFTLVEPVQFKGAVHPHQYYDFNIIIYLSLHLLIFWIGLDFFGFSIFIWLVLVVF